MFRFITGLRFGEVTSSPLVTSPSSLYTQTRTSPVLDLVKDGYVSLSRRRSRPRPGYSEWSEGEGPKGEGEVVAGGRG